MSKELENKKLDQNKLYIIIASAVILLLVVGFLIFSRSGDKTATTDGSNPAAVQTTALQLVNENGDFYATIKADVKPVRDIKLGTSLKKIQKMEKKNKDTDEGSITDAQDGSGYSYLTYHFVNGSGAAPQFFGGTVNPADPTSGIMYVLKDKKLVEVRVLFGASTPENYDAIVGANTSSYGEPNLVRSYSNGTKTTFWRTKDVMLSLYSQYEANGSYSISIYYSQVTNK
ncbi:MAG: hypothetical protein K6G64_06095 [Eubacterium sp.]|nr:hypothetical protein [Eubacterium sp.]